MQLEAIAYYHSPLGEKFGTPRQSGLVPELCGTVVFTEKYRDPNALRGLEQMSHLWLIWGFSENRETAGDWQPTVRPPRLGGNTALGVFATRSPYRPNPLGLSAVALERIESDPELGTVLHVRGADLVDGTPVYDIKPYIRYADCIPEAQSGFATLPPPEKLRVQLADGLVPPFKQDKMCVLTQLLSLDPRPAYQDNPERIYTMNYAGKEVSFRVEGDVLTLLFIE